MKIFTGLLVLTILSSCAVPFDIPQTITISLPNTYGIYIEDAITIPEEVRGSSATFSEVTVDYTVSKTDPFIADVRIMVAPDEIDDDSYDTNHEVLVDVNLGINEDSESGSSTSDNITHALNNDFLQIIIGAENLSASPTSPVEVKMTINFKGTYSLF